MNARVDTGNRRTNYNFPDSYTEGRNTFTRWASRWRFAPSLEVRNTFYYSTHLLDWPILKTTYGPRRPVWFNATSFSFIATIRSPAIALNCNRTHDSPHQPRSV